MLSKLHSAILNLMSWPKDITKKLSGVECYIMNIMLNNSDCEGFLKIFKVAKLVVGYKDFLNYWDKLDWTLAAVKSYSVFIF